MPSDETTVEYQSSLPRKRLAAGVIVVDALGRLLILKPTYRDNWLIPGGVVEENEAPKAAAQREVREELGIDIGELDFVAVDYRKAEPGNAESLHFVFKATPLSGEQVERLVLSEEHSEYRFEDLDSALGLLNDRLRRRLELILKDHRVGYIESGTD